MLINLAIVDDHMMFSQSLAHILNSHHYLQVQAIASNGSEFIGYLNENNNIDVAIVDTTMPILDGWETLKIIRSKYPSVKPILLSSETNQQSTIKAFKLGARSLISKSCETDELVDSIIGVYTNGHFFNDSASMNFFHEIMNSNSGMHAEKEDLTKREKEVLIQICSGKTTLEIADFLCISPHTIDVHRKRINQKLGSNKVADLVIYAIKNGIISI